MKPLKIFSFLILILLFHSCQNFHNETLVQKVIDKDHIHSLLNQHQIFIDSKDFISYSELFAEDGKYESPFATAIGRNEIAKMSKQLHDIGFTKGKRHFSGPIDVQLRENHATAISYWWVADFTQKPTIIFASGMYYDKLERIGSEWYITHRTLVQDDFEETKDVD